MAKRTVKKIVNALGFYAKGAWGDDKVKANVIQAEAERRELLKKVDELHIELQEGNTKTGRISYTVSLYPVMDCGGCKGCHCRNICYDLRHDVINKDCRKYRLINSAIHKADPKRYWEEIEKEIKAKFCVFLRGNVGGDLSNDDFGYLFDMCNRNKKCTFQYFTKNYDGANTAIKANGGTWPDNLKLMFSRLPGLECDNPYHVPEFHINFGDGCPFTGPEYGAYFCNGNCSECYYSDKGCIGAERGDNITVNYH